MSGSRAITTVTTTADHEMERIISEISSGRARTDPAACINVLNPLINTEEGKEFLSTQAGEKALVLIELFDQALKSPGTHLNKRRILWALRRLCAQEETLPESYVLPIDFKATGSHHAAGGFADVWKGPYKGREVAFKSLRGCTQSDDETRLKRKRRFCKEVILWKSLNHPNILGLIGVCRWENTPDARLTMVSEWMPNGNIAEYIKRNHAQRMRLLVDCAKGVEYLHNVNVVHGDLKGANILITSDNPVCARLADFGFTTIIYDEAEKPESSSAQGGGTTPFMAPELLSPNMFRKTRCQMSKEADIYAFAMVILQVLSGSMPFHSLQGPEIAYIVIRGDRPAMPTNAGDIGISDALWKLLIECWNPNYNKRPGVERVLQHISQEPALELVFPPSNTPQVPSCESVSASNTQKFGDIFVTANVYPPTEEFQSFPTPASPADSSHETAIATLFSVEPQDVSPFTSHGNSQTRAEEPKSPVSETPSWRISDRSHSAIVANSAADPATFGHPRKQGENYDPLLQAPGPLHCDYDRNERDPIVGGPPHVDLSVAFSRGAPRSSPRSDPPGGKPVLPKLLTDTQLESKNSNSPGTAFYTPGGSGEVPDRKPFDSAVNIRVVYSGSNPHSRNAAGSTRKVADVRNPTNKWKSEYEFPIQSPRSTAKAAEDGPRRKPTISPAQLSPVTGGHQRDSAFSFSISPFDEFQRDAGSSRCISEATTPATSLWASGSSPMSGFSGETRLPRQRGKRRVPKWDRSENRRGERDDNSHPSASADCISVSSEAGGHQGDQSLTPCPPPNPSLVKQMLTKLGVRKPSSSQKHVTPQARDDASSASVVTMTTDSVDTLAADPGQERERTLSGISFVKLPPWSKITRKDGKKREVKRSIMSFFD